MELEEIENPNIKTYWKSAKWGVITFCVVHFIFEVLTGNVKSVAFPVFANYWISEWYIKRQIRKGKQFKNLFIMGLSISSIVFLIRLLLGGVFYIIITFLN